MNSRTLSTIAIIGFVLLGSIAMGLRYRALRAERIATEDSQWELTYSVQFVAENLTSPEEAEVSLGMPFETRYCDVLSETWNIPNPNLHARVVGPRARDGNRLLLLETRQASPTPYTATASFILRLSPRPNTARDPALENLTIDARTRYLREDETFPTRSNAKVQEVAALAPDDSESEAQRLQWIFEYCSGIDSKPEAAGDTVADAVQFGRGTPWLARGRW